MGRPLGETTTELPRPKQHVKDVFVDVLNAGQPDHPRAGRSIYPVTEADLQWSYKQRTGRLWASCGPFPSEYGKYVYIAFDWEYARTVSDARLLALCVHEATHVAEGSHTEGSGHNPAYWREYAFIALEVRDALDAGEIRHVTCSSPEFLREAADDPNSMIVDNRSETAEERQQKLRELFRIDS